MSRHRRGRAVLSLLIRMGRQHDPTSWTVRCTDHDARRALHVATTGISIDGIHADHRVLTPLQVGRLRAALRQALLAYDRLAGCDAQPERTVAAPTTPDVQEVSDEQLRTRPRRFAAWLVDPTRHRPVPGHFSRVVVMGFRAFRWLPYDGRRHAIPDTLAADDTGRTLCGADVTVPHAPPPRSPDGCWPTCHGCDMAWREHEGIPVFEPPPETGDDRRAVTQARHAEVGGRS